MEANNGEGTWLSADTAHQMGLVGEVIKTEAADKVAAGIEDGVELQAFYMSMVTPDENELVISKTNIYNMEKVLVELGLDLEAKEDKALEMVANLKADKEKAELKAETLEAKVTEQGEIIASFEAAKVEALIDMAIEDKKISKESKDKWLERANADFSLVSEVLADLPSTKVVADITSIIKDEPTEKVESFRELEKSNPSKLKEIEKNNPELYAKMYDAEYKN